MQRRGDYGEPRENFNRDWHDYKYGFGDPAKEVWLGNENIYLLTNSEDYELMVQLQDFENNTRSYSNLIDESALFNSLLFYRYAYYDHFKLGNEESNFKLEVGGYHGNAGDSLNDPWYGANLRPFSTYDK